MKALLDGAQAFDYVRSKVITKRDAMSRLLKVRGFGLLLLVGSCTDDGRSSSTGSGGASAGGASQTGGAANASSDGGGGSGGSQVTNTASGGSSTMLCGGDPRMQCAVDCAAFECGEITSSFDQAGCLREFCSTDTDCASNERCFGGDTAEGGAAGEGSEVEICVGWASCAPNENGDCSCGGGAACWGYCIPR